VYIGETVAINCKVRHSPTTIDGIAFYNAVLAAGLIAEANMPAFQKIYRDSSRTSRAAHTFTAQLHANRF